MYHDFNMEVHPLWKLCELNVIMVKLTVITTAETNGKIFVETCTTCPLNFSDVIYILPEKYPGRGSRQKRVSTNGNETCRQPSKLASDNLDAVCTAVNVFLRSVQTYGRVGHYWVSS